MACTYHTAGTFCSHACNACDRRMLNIAQRTIAREAARMSALMRTKPSAR